jgi:hypothetical protein
MLVVPISRSCPLFQLTLIANVSRPVISGLGLTLKVSHRWRDADLSFIAMRCRYVDGPKTDDAVHNLAME